MVEQVIVYENNFCSSQSNTNEISNIIKNIVSADSSVLTYNLHPNQAMDQTEPIQEAIYDFGGANVKSCASIALSKSISKGLIPPGQWTSLQNQTQNLDTSTNLNLHQANSKTANFRGFYL